MEGFELCYNSDMPKKKSTVKVAYDLTLEAKRKLATLKMELRYKEIPASETGILEVLLDHANVSTVATHYRKYLDSR